MQVLKRAEELKNYSLKCKDQQKKVGFVPTMGALHDGHIDLVKSSVAQNDITVVSIFVNPTQFNNPEDLEKYPRNLEADIELLEENGVDVVFTPNATEIYGELIESEKFELGGLDRVLEGTHRPGHFEGVATVVKKLFEIALPNKAYFGEKDFQQLRIIQHVNKNWALGIEIVPQPTARTETGLARSSRNQRLSDAGIDNAILIYNSVQWAFKNTKTLEPSAIKQEIINRFSESKLELEYVEIADASNLKTIENWSEANSARIFIAAYCEGIRLIDNYKLF